MSSTTSCFLALLVVVCLVRAAVMKRDPTCTNACAVSQDNSGEGTQLLKFMCHCIGEQKLDTMPPKPTTTTTASTTTKSTTKADTTIGHDQICDYLCSIQMGGDACECSNPSLPGK